MKVRTLLAQAAKCKTLEDLENLLETLKRVFGNHKFLSHLGIYNENFDMEDGKPFVSFELNREISDEYVTMIRPEIRDGKLGVSVKMYRINDHLGMFSRDCEVIDGMDDYFEASDNQTLNDLCKRVVEVAIADHRLLIEGVGVPESVAKKAAKSSW